MAYTTIDNSELHFQCELYTGDGGSSKAITLDGSENMKPDLVWIKNRSGTDIHALYDSTRGVNKNLRAEDSAAEGSQSDGLLSFDTDGFTVGAAGSVNTNSNNFVSWNWKANNGTTSSNSDGSITSTVQANTTAGFSIVSYTGTGSAATIGHGLSSAPSMIIVKNRSTAYSWIVYHKSIGATKNTYLDLNNAADTASIQFNDTEPTSSVFSVGTSLSTNKSGDNLIAYCFEEVKGYSRMGSWTGNGNADGTFTYTGFRPAFLLYKNTSEADEWFLHDNRRLGYNDENEYLFASITQAEGTQNRIRFTANGFKALNSDKGVNKSGNVYVYLAIAEYPLVNSKGIPGNAI